MASKNERFDLRTAATYFRRSIKRNDAGEEDVDIGDYVTGYNELNKLFYKMGRLFSFVADDVKEKTQILTEHQQSAVGDRYQTAASMIAYELHEVRILDDQKQKFRNGSRTLLRLHRALLFIVKFIDAIKNPKDSDKMAPLARKAYDETLAQYHPWAVRKMVHLAVVGLPKRETLIKNFTGPVKREDVETVLEETVASSQTVYEVVQRLYESNQILNLP